MALTLFNDPTFSEMERLMDRVASTFGQPVLSLARPPRASMAAPAGTHHLAMDIVEKPSAFELHADAPGMSPDDVKVELQDGVLTVSGQRTIARTDKDEEGKMWRSERSSYSFTRSFTLPETANGDAISAAIDKGVLTVTIPKKPEAPKPEPKRITVTGA